MVRKTVVVLLFDGAEELDYVGPWEALCVANRIAGDLGIEPVFNLVAVGEHAGAIHSAGGLRVVPDATLESAPHAHILIVPGGAGTRRGDDLNPVIDFIKRVSMGAELVTSVCTGSFLLARANLLDGLAATTHWASIARFRDQFPSINVVENQKVVDQGKIITAGGISSGIDLGLHVVARLMGERIASLTAKRMEWNR